MGIKVDSLLRDRFDVMRYKDSRQVRVSCNLGVSPFEVIFYKMLSFLDCRAKTREIPECLQVLTPKISSK
jgi:hypothetical protein